ncbi:hypothetical protein [Neomegalonema perideroedes]|uniref:hypothetical protein n=1 Tax=Neomegalonema perideroedes TaxID=217219 RepID=UPI00037D9F25|nr:hypothetical protein [Neomegalonema perideroedes]
MDPSTYDPTSLAIIVGVFVLAFFLLRRAVRILLPVALVAAAAFYFFVKGG